MTVKRSLNNKTQTQRRPNPSMTDINPTQETGETVSTDEIKYFETKTCELRPDLTDEEKTTVQTTLQRAHARADQTIDNVALPLIGGFIRVLNTQLPVKEDLLDIVAGVIVTSAKEEESDLRALYAESCRINNITLPFEELGDNDHKFLKLAEALGREFREFVQTYQFVARQSALQELLKQGLLQEKTAE